MKHVIPPTLLLSLTYLPLCLVAQEQNLALLPPSVLSPIPKEFEDDQRGFQGIPSMTIAPNGRLWACWYGGGSGETSENYVLLVTSGDGGNTWTKPILAIDIPGPIRAFDPSMWTDPDGKVWLFWAQGDGTKSIWDGRCGVWSMTTDMPDRVDAVWAAPKRICDGIMMCKPIADSKGRWLLPCAVWNITPDHPDRMLSPGAHVIASEDKGKTWFSLGYSTVPRKDALYDEHNIVEMKNGAFWMLHRTRYGIAESYSTDAGKTWTEPRPSLYQHPSTRFFIRRLQSGNLLFVKHGEIKEKTAKRSHLRAFISDDDGKTWKGGLLLDERESISYPDGDQMKDGMICVIYDWERYKNREILMARFTEEDVLAGKIVSPNGTLRLLVNKATGVVPPKPTKEPDNIVVTDKQL